MSEADVMPLRTALAKVRVAKPQDKPKAASDAGRLAIDVVREIDDRRIAKQFVDLFEHDLREVVEEDGITGAPRASA